MDIITVDDVLFVSKVLQVVVSFPDIGEVVNLPTGETIVVQIGGIAFQRVVVKSKLDSKVSFLGNY